MAIDTKRKNKAYGIHNALQKLSPIPIVSNRAPNGNDKNFSIGQIWIDQPNDDSYILTSITNNQGNWQSTSADTAGSASISKYIVDKDGSTGYITVQSALDKANIAGGGIVYVRPGIYIENLTCYDKTEIVGAVGQVGSGNVIIQGTHIPPTSGTFSITRIQLNSATDVFNSAIAGTATISINECVLNVTNGYTLNLPNWIGQFRFDNCGAFGTDDGFINNTAGATIFTNNSQLGAGTANTYTANGIIRHDLTYIVCPANLTGSGSNIGLLSVFGNTLTLGGSASWEFDNGSKFFNTLTISASASVKIYNSIFDTGANQAINHSGLPLTISDVTIDSTNALPIGGTGVLHIGSITFINNNAIAGTIALINTPRIVSSGLKISTGLNATMGFATLAAGTKIVPTSAVTANSRIFLTHETHIGTVGNLSAPAALRIPGTSFTILSSNPLDSSTVVWLIIEPA